MFGLVWLYEPLLSYFMTVTHHIHFLRNFSTVFDSPTLPEADATFAIGPHGVCDATE